MVVGNARRLSARLNLAADQRGRDAPPIEVQTTAGPGDRQIGVAVVRAGMREMARTGELSRFFQTGYAIRQRPR
jgi:hypothetical protein